MTFDVEHHIGPSYWACYFINGDASGMENGDIAQADAWREALGPDADIVSCEGEAYYSSAYWPWRTTPFTGGEVIAYTILRRT